MPGRTLNSKRSYLGSSGVLPSLLQMYPSEPLRLSQHRQRNRPFPAVSWQAYIRHDDSCPRVLEPLFALPPGVVLPASVLPPFARALVDSALPAPPRPGVRPQSYQQPHAPPSSALPLSSLSPLVPPAARHQPFQPLHG